MLFPNYCKYSMVCLCLFINSFIYHQNLMLHVHAQRYVYTSVESVTFCTVIIWFMVWYPCTYIIIIYYYYYYYELQLGFYPVAVFNIQVFLPGGSVQYTSISNNFPIKWQFLIKLDITIMPPEATPLIPKFLPSVIPTWWTQPPHFRCWNITGTF
jgi:hypothetical protein